MINSIKYIIPVISVLVFSIPAMAQRDSILSREVEVTKTYKPTISDANKINDMPEAEKTLHKPPAFDYSIKSTPVVNTFSVKPLKAAAINMATKKNTGYGLVRAGFGNYSKPYGEFFFNNLNSRRSVFGLHARHISSHGNLTLEGGDKVDAPYSKSEAAIYFKQSFTRSVLSVDLDVKHDGFSYYGYPVEKIPDLLKQDEQEVTLQGAGQAFTKGGFNISLDNPTAKNDDPLFNFNARYHYFGTKTEQKEHLGSFTAEVRKPLDKGVIHANLGASYTQADGIAVDSLGSLGERSQTWLFANPAWFYGGKTADICIGIKGWFVLDSGNDAVAKITPDIQLNFRPVADVIRLYAGIDGDYKNNHYSAISYDNPFVDPRHNVENSFEKIRFYGGIDGKFSDKTNFRISAGYSMIDDQPLYYLNEYYYPQPLTDPVPSIVYNAFDVLYDDLEKLKIGLELFHNSSEKTELLITGNYYVYKTDKEDKAWNMPEWDAGISLDYKITSQLTAGADVFLTGERTALIRSYDELVNSPYELPGNSAASNNQFVLDPVFDLNVNASYQATQNLSVFGQLNNFGFQKYQRWLGYPVQSFNVLAGISYSF